MGRVSLKAGLTWNYDDYTKQTNPLVVSMRYSAHTFTLIYQRLRVKGDLNSCIRYILRVKFNDIANNILFGGGHNQQRNDNKCYFIAILNLTSYVMLTFGHEFFL